MKVREKLFLLLVFSAAMALAESATVVYINEIIVLKTVSVELLPLQYLLSIGDNLYIIELLREVSTIIMLASIAIIFTGSLKARDLLKKGVYFFMFAFGVWDILYYVFLKLFIGWPASFLDFDVLFSIPVSWVGPVLAPILVSLALISISLFKFHREGGKNNYLIILTGALIIFFTFVTCYTVSQGLIIPQDYNWVLFFAGLAFFVSGFLV